MEAANLGGYSAAMSEGSLEKAITDMSARPSYQDDHYIERAYEVIDRHPRGERNLAIPTWFYGHEPTNQFATHIAKYFANSIREDGLLAIATRGVVFSPGSAGTTQEVFQDATQNHYAVFGTVSPMVFLGSAFWNEQLPAEPLLRTLAADRPYAAMIGSADTAAEAIEFLRANLPVQV